MDIQPDSAPVDFAEFDSEQEFLVVRALLESQGIECFSPMLISAMKISKRSEQGLTLQVREEDVDAARAILEAPFQAEASDEEDS
jgi:hypothetical protein